MDDAARAFSVERYRELVDGGLRRLTPQKFHVPSLDALNFLVADVRGALGPFVTVYLATDRHWALTDVGLVTTLGGWVGLLAQTPLGMLLDATQRRRGLIAAALVVLGAGALAIALFPGFWPVLAANSLMQAVGGIFNPAVAALTMGLFARRELTRRMGRNAAFARAGNLSIAVGAGAIAWTLTSRGVFLMVPVLALGGVVAALSIPHTAIDNRRARGLRSGEKEESGPAAWRHLLRSRPLLVFGAASLLLEFADAPLLTLAAQELGATHPGLGVVMTSATIVAQQAGMLVAAILIGRRGDRWGHLRMLRAAVVIIVVQGVLTGLGSGLYWLIGVQVLGGLGVGLFAALTPRVLADVMEGTGRYNAAQGAVATLRSLGVTSSGLATEWVVARLGYDVAFFGCAAVAVAALLLLWRLMPDTQSRDD